MQIEDFLPKYPIIENTQINPYDLENFNNVIFSKKEFNEEKMSKCEKFPKESGNLMKHQKIIARFLSSHTPYDSLLLLHEMGTGKTCAAIGAVEKIKNENSKIDGAIVVASKGLIKNFKEDLLYRCTSGKYIPEDEDGVLKKTTLDRRINKSIGSFYKFFTYHNFVTEINKLDPRILIKKYSNKVIIIDEVHNIKEDDKKDKDKLNKYKIIFDFLHIIKNSKKLLLSGTPMTDDVTEISSILNLILPKENQLPRGKNF